ncbi:MAG: archaellin/type IV pilin N-terminal domain-containing protein [Ignisphaera sp.]
MSARKGISPIVATVILVMIAVAAGVLLWTWVSGAVARAPPSEQQALQERIRITGISYSDSNVVVYVLNLGSVNVDIVYAAVLDNNGQTVCLPSSGATVNAKINAKNSGSVTISGCSLTSGNVYEVIVITARGTEARYTFTV